MTAIDKMVEWLAAITVPAEWAKDNQYRQGYRCSVLEATGKAIKLRDEERAQKPTAPASLVGMLVIENKNLPEGKAYLVVQDKGLVKQMVEVSIPDHPAPSSDEGLREEILKLLRAEDCVINWRAELSNLVDTRHPAPKDRCAELVERLREWKEKYIPDVKWGLTTGDKRFHAILSEFSKDADGGGK